MKLFLRQACASLTLSFVISTTAYTQIALEKCKFLGNVIGSGVPTSFSTYWNQVTPENSGKWGSVEATRNSMNWAGLDVAYNFAQANNYPFKQHTFVWGQQQPAWLTTLMADTSIPQEERYAQVRAEVEEWIRQFCERYPNTDMIDVVNEPFHATPVYDLALGTGWNWVIWAFEKARQYCPNAKLLLNDYNIINNDGTTNNYLALINLLKAQNLIDGIGIQCHRFEVERAPVTQLKSNLDKLATSGLPIYISEFDIGNLDNASTGNSTTDDNVQLEIMQRVFPVLWEHPAVYGITVWGYLQGQTWQSTANLLRADGSERPALTWLKNYVPSKPGGSFCLTTSINTLNENVEVFPNPAATGNGILVVSQKYGSLVVRDLHGKTIVNLSLQPSQQQVVKIAIPGVYLFNFYISGARILKKVIVY
ncbi:MAG: endo-1,4-beta-xylanase [Cytophagales bacterium]|nr:endo-1,4-beta-xylanase [Cytophagales bacterium]